MDPVQGEERPLSDVLVASSVAAVDVAGSRVRVAVADASVRTLVAATEANEIVAGGSTRMAVAGPVRALSVSRFVAVEDGGLPTTSSVLVCLLEDAGLCLFELPGLRRVEGGLSKKLASISARAPLFASDALGGGVVGESFRLVVVVDHKIVLLGVNVPQDSVNVLSESIVSEPVVSLAFAEMAIVATTAKDHCMFRIARSGNMALAALVSRSDPSTRPPKNAPVTETGAAVMSFFGGIFARRERGGVSRNQLAFPLPDNRWVLNIDQELVTYSSFGAKLDNMENAFKSKQAIDIPESAVTAALSVVEIPSRPGGSAAGSAHSGPPRLTRTVSVSSMASLNSAVTTYTARTLVDEAMAKRAEKPPSSTVFASPFVLSVTDKNQLLAFASNGSVPGVIFSLDLVEEGKKLEQGARIAPCSNGLRLALVYWPSGRVVEVNLAENLNSLVEEREEAGDFRSALSLVPIDDVDRTIALRRRLAVQAREADWHDAAIDHMQHVVNLCVAREGVGQVDLLVEAVELRGLKGTSWESDGITATLWADFLFKLRRRILFASSADVAILETMCKADVTATRIKALLNVKHSVPIEAGELAISASDCALHEHERVEALATLYTSLGEHDKALILLENSGINRVLQAVCAYLHKSIDVVQEPEVFFRHVRWVGSESAGSKSDEVDFLKLVDVIVDAAISAEAPVNERIMQEMMQIVVEHTPHLIPIVVNRLCPDVPDEEVEKPSETEQFSGVNDVGNGSAKLDGATKKKDADLDGEQKPKAELPVQTKEIPKSQAVSMSDANSSDARTCISLDLLAVTLLSGMAKAHLLEDHGTFEKLRSLLGSRVLHLENADYHSEKLLKVIQSQSQTMSLHEELAFLLGRQGRHEAAANELAAEPTLSTLDAQRQFEKLLPVGDKSSATQALVAAYLRVSSQGRANRVEAAAEVVRREGGFVDVESILDSLHENNEVLTLGEMKPFLQATVVAGNERLRTAEMMKAIRISEVRRVREEVLMRRRRCVIIGHDRACCICTRRIGESVFAAYPDGSVAHLVCHMSSLK